MKVLIADDDEFMRFVLIELLQEWGHEVVAARDGKQALSALQQPDGPVLAILDWMMPEMDGIAVCRAIRGRQDGPYVYIILLTARDQKADYLEGMEAGVDNYLTKPFDVEQLRSQLRVGARIAGMRGTGDHDESHPASADERLVLALHGGNAGVWDWSLHTGTAYFNAQWAAMLGYAEEEVGDAIDFWEQRIHPEDAPLVLEALNNHLQELTPAFEAEHRLRARGGEWIWVLTRGLVVERDAEGAPLRLVGTQMDISKQKEREMYLQYQALHDPLTALPNRVLFHDHLLMELSRARRHQVRLAVLYLDLDGFKQINDSFGHAVGDVLLQQFAQRINGLIRENDTFARLGGDEFAVLLTDIDDRSDALAVAHKILSALDTPFINEENELFVSTSIGIALYPDDSNYADELLQLADQAMYAAKDDGKCTVRFHSYDQSKRSLQERFTLAGELRHAIEREEMVLFYQPEVRRETRELVALEALIRWEHPRVGLLLPDEFLPIIEEIGLMHQLGDWTIREVCRQTLRWQQAGYQPVKITVNLSKSQFFNDGLSQRIGDIVDDSQMPVELLNLEVDERVVMANLPRSIEILGQLAHLGVQTSIDHFGVGIASFVQLRNLPITTFKLDQSITRGDIGDNSNRLLTEVAVGIAHSLNLQVVVCGVETEPQLERSKELACDSVQGFLISRPLPASEVEALLANREACSIEI